MDSKLGLLGTEVANVARPDFTVRDLLRFQKQPMTGNGMARPRQATTLLGCGWGSIYAKLKEPAMRTSQKTPTDR
jgi:hypothetical protein